MNIIIPHGFEANFTLGFARGLAANGVNATIVSCDDTAASLSSAGIPNVNLRGSLDPNRSVWKRLWNLAAYYIRLLVLLWRHRGATVHFSGIFRNKLILWEGLVLHRCIRVLAGRYLYTVHNVVPHNREKSSFYRWIYRRVYQLPDVLLVHTRRARKQLIAEFSVPEQKIVLTTIGLNEEVPVTCLTRKDARRRLGLADDDQVVLFFGKLDKYKGVDLLLEAFDNLESKHSRLVIAGSFNYASYQADILRQLQQMRRREAVFLFNRFVPNEDVETFFKAADVLCMPYRNIYQSGLLFLAMRFGVPLIATDVGALREFIGEALGLVSKTNDAAGIRDALNEFFADPRRFPRAQILHHAAKYQWSAVCRDLVPLYASCPKTAGSSN